MISLARVSVNMGKNYFANENYYTREQGIEQSEWFGQGAKFLGLEGKVSAGVFQDLLERKGLLQEASSSKSLACGTEKRAALDLTFSAPKSVSLACFLGGDSRLEDAHRLAVNSALRVSEERYALTRTGGQKDRKIESTGNLLVAQFHHDTSRAKDPQIHTHCVVMNAVKRQSDGEWRSLHNDGVYANSKLLGLVYQNELAKQVQLLGYGIELKSNGTFELQGYEKEHLREFSKRREQIEDLGAKDQKEARNVVKKNRPAKGKEVSREDLKAVWEHESNRLGIVHPKRKRFTAYGLERMD